MKVLPAWVYIFCLVFKEFHALGGVDSSDCTVTQFLKCGFAVWLFCVLANAMKCFRLLVVSLLLPYALSAADRSLKIDKARSYVDVDVDATINFTGRLEDYQTSFSVDAAGKIKTATLAFKFADLKTGKTDRDAKMIQWLGGGLPDGKFEAGIIVVAPDGQGQVTGKLTFHGVTTRVEFPVNVARNEGTYVITGEATIDYREWELKIIKIAFIAKVNPLVKIRFKFTGTLPAVPEEK